MQSPYNKTLFFNSADGILQFVAKLWLYLKRRDHCPLESRQTTLCQLDFLSLGERGGRLSRKRVGATSNVMFPLGVNELTVLPQNIPGALA